MFWKTWNATGGALLVTLFLTTTTLALLPTPPELAFALVAHAVIPLWVLLACLFPLAVRSR